MYTYIHILALIGDNECVCSNQGFTVGLSFTIDEEATKFHQAVLQKQERLKERGESAERNMELVPVEPISRPPVTVNSSIDLFAKKTRPKRPKGKLTKSDVGAPERKDFRHYSHVGFDPSTGTFSVSQLVNMKLWARWNGNGNLDSELDI